MPAAARKIPARMANFLIALFIYQLPFGICVFSFLNITSHFIVKGYPEKLQVNLSLNSLRFTRHANKNGMKRNMLVPFHTVPFIFLILLI